MTPISREHERELVLDLHTFELSRDGKRIKLEKGPMELLILLAGREGGLVTRDEIVTALWGDSVHVDVEAGVNTAIRKIRHALGDNPNSPTYLETVVGKGYRFIGPITIVTNTQLPDAGSKNAALTQVPQQRLEKKLVVVVVGMLGLAIAGWLSLHHVLRGEAKQTIDSIAVMPFVNASADPNTDYLADGITESLINNMSHVSNLKVISRASVFHYKGSDVDPQKLAHDLGVRAVLTGRLEQRGDSLFISAELIDAHDMMHLWGEQYSRKLADLPAIQEDISREITRKLRPRLSTTEQERLATGGTNDAEAYQLYIKGRYFWNKRDVEAFKKARDYFQQAIERDPNYALAYTGLADSYALLGHALAEVLHSEEEHKEGDRKAIAASKKALEIDDTLGEAHASYAYALFDSSDFPGAEKEFKRALELNPNYASAHHWYANLLLFAGDRQEEALTEIRRAQQLDPLSLIINTWVGEHLFAMNRIDEAIEQYKKVLEMDPNFIQAHANLAEAYDVKGMYPQAIDEYEIGIFHTPQSVAKAAAEAASLRSAYKSAGARGYWLKRLELAKSARNHPETAAIYDILGDKENAIRELQTVGPDDNWYMLIDGPYYQDLRSDPRFQDQVRRVREFYKGSSSSH
jgi:TolB-like protein/DNA-binding winged helix-turn-helix (wHTH) protein/Tfp pilus assembly protein PilF